MTLLHSSAPRWFALAVLLLLPAAAWSDIKALTADQDGKPQKLWVYVGTYTGGNSKGIYRLELDLASGKLTLQCLAAETANPSFRALHPSHRVLYAVT